MNSENIYTRTHARARTHSTEQKSFFFCTNFVMGIQLLKQTLHFDASTKTFSISKHKIIESFLSDFYLYVSKERITLWKRLWYSVVFSFKKKRSKFINFLNHHALQHFFACALNFWHSTVYISQTSSNENSA